MLENQDQDLTLTDLSHNTLSYQLSQNLNFQHQNSVIIKDIIYYNYAKNEPQTVQVINQTAPKLLMNQDIMSPSSNSSSSPASVSINPAIKHNLNDSHDTGNKSLKKSQKKKSSQVTSEIDEERTSQLVSEILKNIKEKTKELESLNQNLKSTTIADPKSTLKINNVSQCESDFAKTYSQDSFINELTDSNDFYDSDCSKSQPKQKKTKTKSSKPKTGKKSLEIPQGWTRIIDLDKTIVYISPIGYRLKSHQDIKSYLLSDQTCKCGLECPLNIYETFNFSPLVEASQSAKKSSKNPCLCKHVCHGIKKQKNLVKVLDEVNQNSKRNNSEKKSNTNKKAKLMSQPNKHEVYGNQNNNNQIEDQSILISNLILNSDIVNQEDNMNFVNASNNLIFNKSFDFNPANHFDQVELNPYSHNDEITSENLGQTSLNYGQSYDDVCQMVNNHSQL